MTSGRIVWFSESKGYGYIADIQGREIYFHYTSIAEKGPEKSVTMGVEVSFDLFETSIGFEASNVRLIR